MTHNRKQLLSIDISSQQHEYQQGPVIFSFSELSIPVQETHPASYSVCTGVLLRGLRRSGREFDYAPQSWGTAVAQWLRCCVTNRKVAGSIPAGVIGFFIDIKPFRSHYGPGVDSASNRNEYQEYFLWGKCSRRVRLTTYHHPVPLSRNLGILTSWNPLGPSEPVMGLLYLLPQSCANFKNRWSYTSTPPYVPSLCGKGQIDP